MIIKILNEIVNYTWIESDKTHGLLYKIPVTRQYFCKQTQTGNLVKPIAVD